MYQDFKRSDTFLCVLSALRTLLIGSIFSC